MPPRVKPLKIRRKDLKQPDEFETLTGQTLDLVNRYRTAVALIAGVAVTIAVALIAFTHWRASQARAAAIAFWAAHDAFDAGRFDEAAQDFTAVAARYPGTPSGRLAPLYHAHAMARKGDHAAAAVAYAEYLARGPAAAYLQQEALAGLGHARAASGDGDGALEAFTQAAAVDGPFEREALLGAARLHEAGGRAADAQAIYGKLLEDAPPPDVRALLLSKLPPGSEKGAEAAAASNVR